MHNQPTGFIADAFNIDGKGVCSGLTVKGLFVTSKGILQPLERNNVLEMSLPHGVHRLGMHLNGTMEMTVNFLYQFTLQSLEDNFYLLQVDDEPELLLQANIESWILGDDIWPSMFSSFQFVRKSGEDLSTMTIKLGSPIVFVPFMETLLMGYTPIRTLSEDEADRITYPPTMVTTKDPIEAYQYQQRGFKVLHPSVPGSTQVLEWPPVQLTQTQQWLLNSQNAKRRQQHFEEMQARCQKK